MERIRRLQPLGRISAFYYLTGIEVSTITMKKHRNRLLAALPAADLNLLEAQLQSVQLEKRRVLEAPHKTIDYVY
ncbi:MAG: hypothetical protein ACTHPD_04275, partial [Rhizomicrobium sp.]